MCYVVIERYIIKKHSLIRQKMVSRAGAPAHGPVLMVTMRLMLNKVHSMGAMLVVIRPLASSFAAAFLRQHSFFCDVLCWKPNE